MLYICERTGCHFAFEFAVLPDQCPECGGIRIHPAQDAELRQYQQERSRMNITAYSGKHDFKR